MEREGSKSLYPQLLKRIRAVDEYPLGLVEVAVRSIPYSIALEATLERVDGGATDDLTRGLVVSDVFHSMYLSILEEYLLYRCDYIIP